MTIDTRNTRTAGLDLHEVDTSILGDSTSVGGDG